MSRQIVVGEILGAFGVRGWVKVQSHTEPPENILRYSPWRLAGGGGEKDYRVIEGRPHGGTLVIVRLEGLSDRDQAALLHKHQVSVPRECFSHPQPGEYYWADLIGLEVRNLAGVVLGRVAGMMETGANDVMEVHGERERLIPFVMGDYVKEVRLDEGWLLVDWEADF